MQERNSRQRTGGGIQYARGSTDEQGIPADGRGTHVAVTMRFRATSSRGQGKTRGEDRTAFEIEEAGEQKVAAQLTTGSGSFFLRAERANVLRREHCPEAYSPPRGPPGLNSARGLRADVKGHRTSAPRASSRQHGRRTMAGIPQRSEHASRQSSNLRRLVCSLDGGGQFALSGGSRAAPPAPTGKQAALRELQEAGEGRSSTGGNRAARLRMQ